METRTQYPRGTYSKVARRLKVSPQHVRNVALGRTTSRRIAVQLARIAAATAKAFGKGQ